MPSEQKSHESKELIAFVLHALSELRESLNCPFSSCGTANQATIIVSKLEKHLQEYMQDTFGELSVLLLADELRDTLTTTPTIISEDKLRGDAGQTMYLTPLHHRIEGSSDFLDVAVDTEAPTREIPEIPPSVFLEQLLKEDD